MYDVIVIGAGPCGLSVAIECKKRGLTPLVIEKGCLANSIYHFPLYMEFFSTPEMIEIGGMPFTTWGRKPGRTEALKYYLSVARRYQLDIHTFEKVIQIKRGSGQFVVSTQWRDEHRSYVAAHVVVATGYYDSPKQMKIPGESLSKVYHYFREAHPFTGLEVTVIGGRNSAIDAALELQQVGANVTMVYRRSAFTSSVKAWIRPIIESAISKGQIKMLWDTEVERISMDEVEVCQAGERISLKNDVVFAMTGYKPQLQLLQGVGAAIDAETGAPVLNEETMESTIPGLYVAGVIVGGDDTSRIFIENGRFHGEKIAAHISTKQD
ncbi:YpdA family putative bacillithiol disulfide reductase [Mechercharimyces sp. CAU 1602]|uniref:YpdA family putative bacillithiol disulfide reductase n=1 Tax=Mechercharimyces sp. CAU 1602 TaxID=2973933 RepID=UPI002161D4C9|nr:YpdA family putative bacillithiol disulfide reductase [Mechercharimyces sp. CAU 1602]MCS1350959.1 YpdA family putative bacillithiol disulfide reductase [Mechercharimyces sp. CAU 1602]